MRKYDKICPDQIVFDFDSTIFRGELLEIIADIALKNNPKKKSILAEIGLITNLGMTGVIPFEESLARRLRLIDLSNNIVKEVLEKIPCLIDQDYLAIRPQLSKFETYVVSGGYKNLIDPLSKTIEISRKNIFANELLFNDNGAFLGVNKKNCLAYSDGKTRAIKKIKKPNSSLLMIGDGMTDLMVKKSGVADYFIAYTGVVDRKEVSQAADHIIRSFLEIDQIISFSD